MNSPKMCTNVHSFSTDELIVMDESHVYDMEEFNQRKVSPEELDDIDMMVEMLEEEISDDASK